MKKFELCRDEMSGSINHSINPIGTLKKILVGTMALSVVFSSGFILSGCAFRETDENDSRLVAVQEEYSIDDIGVLEVRDIANEQSYFYMSSGTRKVDTDEHNSIKKDISKDIEDKGWKVDRVTVDAKYVKLLFANEGYYYTSMYLVKASKDGDTLEYELVVEDFTLGKDYNKYSCAFEVAFENGNPTIHNCISMVFDKKSKLIGSNSGRTYKIAIHKLTYFYPELEGQRTITAGTLYTLEDEINRQYFDGLKSENKEKEQVNFIKPIVEV